jgi:RHS repeat-associated protein
VSEGPGGGLVFESASFDGGSAEMVSAHSELDGAAAGSAGIQGSAGTQLRQWLPTVPAAEAIDRVEGVADQALSQATDITSRDAGNLLTQQQRMLETEARNTALSQGIAPDFPPLAANGDGGAPGLAGQTLSGPDGEIPPLTDGGTAGEPGTVSDGGAGTGGAGAGGRLSDAAGDSDKAAQPLENMTTGGDPVDVASGDVVLAQADVQLPGALPLVVRRAHRSSYRAGRWFGRSWASTLDQRLEVSADGVFLAAVDGVVLCYPHPGDDGAPVWPVTGARWPLARDGDGYTVTDPQAGTVRRFEPRSGYYVSAAGYGELPLVSVTSRAGHRIIFAYDLDGAPETITHDGGYQIRVATAGGRVASLALARAGEDGEDVVLARYGYESSGNLAEVVNSSGVPLRFSCDEAGRLTGWHDRNGWFYRYSYDAEGRCVRGEGPVGTLSGTFSFDRENLVTTHTDTAGAVTVYQLTGRSQVAAVTDPLGHVTRSEHDQVGQLVSRTDPLGRVTSWSYDGAGSLTAITRPDGSRATAAYNRTNLPVVVTEPGGATWRQDYDATGNLVRRTGPDGAVTRYSYDARGHLAGVTDPVGAVTGVECNAAGLPVAVTSPDGAPTRYARDGFGRITRITGPDGSVTGLTWTIDGQLASRTFPDGTAERFSYDGEGNLVTHLNPAAGLTRAEYTCFDQVAARTGPDGTRSEFGYDHALRLTKVIHGGLLWRYEYDLAGRLVAETDYNGAVMRYDYDAAGQLTGRVNGAGQRTGYAYDLLGNLTERQADGVVTSFGYDAAGRVLRAANPDAAILLERDPLGRVTAETCNGRAVRSSYDLAGRRVRRITPSGAETRWDYDASGRPVVLRAAGQSIRFGYDQAGRETRRDLPGGATLTQEWDPSGQLAAQVLTGGAGLDSPQPGPGPVPPGPAGAERVLQRRGYSYRADGYLAGVEDLLAGPRRFGLDPAGRVTGVTGPGWAERYAYDPAGNITAATWPAPPPGPAGGRPGRDEQGAREYAGTLISRAGDFRYRHDRQGRITTRQRMRLSRKPDTWQYTWDADDRLTAVTTPDGTRWRYLYDPLGRRIGKQRLDSGGRVAEQTRFTWDGPVLAEQATIRGDTFLGSARPAWLAVPGDGCGQEPDQVITWDYRPGTFTPLTQAERGSPRGASQAQVDEQFYAIVTDLIGSPAELVDQAGDLAGYQQRTLWGTTVWRGETATPLRFPGQYADPETGLHYNNHRYYDPVTGRYLTPDPLGLAPAPNPHTYVPNPLLQADPLGLMSCGNESAGSGYNPANLGQSYNGRVVVEDPQIKISGFRGSTNPNSPFHGLDRTIARGVSPQDIMNTMRNPSVVLEQGSGSSYLYLSDNAAVVIRPSGQVVTVWGAHQFNPTTLQILRDAQGGP